MNVRSPWYAAGFLAGVAIGGALALLLAPMPGKQLTEMIRGQIGSASRDAREAGKRAEADVLTRYRAIRSASGSTQVGLASAPSVQS